MAVRDKELRTLYQMGLDALHRLSRPYGVAASEATNGDYDALFGRDSLWTLLLLLAALEAWTLPDLTGFVEQMGLTILLSLLESQGTEVRDYNDEQPGKIVHERREHLDNRLIRMRFPFHEGRSYAGFDQTFLFVTAVAEYLGAFPECLRRGDLLNGVQRAVDWIWTVADEDGDGLYEYTPRNPEGLLNQVWKDSFDSISNNGLSPPHPPVAWIEIQGYAYRALCDAARLGLRAGGENQEDSSRRAAQLRTKVRSDFWLEEEGCYAIAVDGHKRPIAAIASNPGHCLWAGLPSDEDAERIARRITAPDMLTAYGIRTLSALDDDYAPLAYHRGSIWPFDNAVIAMGLVRYHDLVRARKVLEALVSTITTLGCPAEVYSVVSSDAVMTSEVLPDDLLLWRRVPVRNRTQAFTAAALIYAISILSIST